MLQKTAILITSTDDKNLNIDNKEKDKYALDYSIILNSKVDIKYFFNGIPNNLANLPSAIARSWYRNLDNVDIHGSKYSSGMVLEMRIAPMISKIIQFYYSFSELEKVYKTIEVPCNYPEFLGKIFNIFKKNIKFIPEQIYSKDLGISIKKRNAIKKVNVNKYSPIFRFLQKPFIRLMRNRTIMFPDWTYLGQKNKNYLYQNGLNIFNSFYYKDIDKKNDDEMPKPVSINTDAIQLLLDKYNIEPNDSYNLLVLIQDIISIEYNASIKVLEQQYFVMENLISYYKPSKIIIPDDGFHAAYNMLMQVASKSKIETVTVLDGYLMFLDVDKIRIKEDGVSPLVKNYATMGSLNHEMVGNVYPKFNRVFIKAPLLSYLSNKVKPKKIYDALIMMPDPDALNPNNRSDMKNRYIIDVINCLKLMKIDKIAVKIKAGLDMYDIKFLQDYFIKNNVDNVEFIRGFGYEAISKSSIVVGQLGTSAYESLVMKIPYFIYEPMDNGLTDINMKYSIINDDHIARSIVDLSENISNKKNIKILIEGLVDGPEMSSAIM
ncbi:hypothetical protein N9A38_00330 [Gammaproteobacteria bacterium]|nr:hypothetical protein [Gammaproteobacteria bacterium]